MPTAIPAPSLVDWPADALKGVRRLAALPARAVFIGRCVREALGGQVPTDLAVLTEARPGQVLAVLPEAVAIGEARVTLPGPGARVDILSTPADVDLAEALRARDLSIDAVGLDPLGKEPVDPVGGLADLAVRRIRPAREAGLRSALAALRACALVASEGFEATPELRVAMQQTAGGISDAPRARVRALLGQLLLGEQVEAGLALLHESGLAQALAPHCQPDAARWVAQLPPDLTLRLLAWLHGARTVRVLRRLRFPPAWVDHVERLLRHHPVEQHATTLQARRRLARRSPSTCDDLFTLRRAELVALGDDPGARSRLDETQAAIAALQEACRESRERPSLALDGRAVMEQLGCRPGPRVGRALAHLERAVARDPALNTERGLRELLDAWDEAREG